jgi:hypothetical protein
MEGQLMNSSDPYRRSTVPEQYPQFSSNPDQDLQDWFQFSRKGSYSFPSLSSSQNDEEEDSVGGMLYEYEPPSPQVPISQYSLLLQRQSQGPGNRLWQWYLMCSNKQRFAIGCGILVSLLVLGTIFGAVAGAGAGLSRHQTTAVQATVVQATQIATDQMPMTPTPRSMLIPNPTVRPTLPPNPTPTFVSSPIPTPNPTPKPVEKFNVIVTSQMVKKIGIEYRYIFDILNKDSRSFGGSAIIALYNDQQQMPLAQQTFNLTQLLQPGLASTVYFDISTGPISQQSGNGVTHFKYILLVNGQQANAGGGQITDNYEDATLF